MADKIDIQQIHYSIMQVLSDAAKQLALFLEKILPSLADNWWEKAVLNNLSEQQQRRIKQYNKNSLTSLDLAALLRILDNNWFYIASILNLPSESRDFVKEMRSVRNRWMHVGTDGFSIDDLYRDVDTVQRFLIVIDSDGYLLQKIKAMKLSMLSGIFSVNDELEKQKIREEKRNKDLLVISIDQQKEDKINGLNITKIEIAVKKMTKGWITPEELQELCGFKDLHNLKMAVSIKANPKRTKHPIKLEKKVIDGRMHWRIAED